MKLSDFVPNPDNEANILQEGLKSLIKKEIQVEKVPSILNKRPSPITPVDQIS